MQLMRLNASLHKISHIFISHLHGDHHLGLMGLLFSMHMNRRESDLHLYSFKGLDEIIVAQLRYSQSNLHFKIVFHELHPENEEIIFEDEAISVTTIPLLHKIPCHGFLFREKPKPRRIDKSKLTPGMLLQHIAQLKTGSDVRTEAGDMLYKNVDFTLPPHPSVSYAYCSDTGYLPALAKTLRGVDLLYHEATFMESEKSKALETKHCTAADAARVAMQAEVKQLVIGHFSARYRDLEPLLAEAQAIFRNTALATECTTFTINA